MRKAIAAGGLALLLAACGGSGLAPAAQAMVDDLVDNLNEFEAEELCDQLRESGGRAALAGEFSIEMTEALLLGVINDSEGLSGEDLGLADGESPKDVAVEMVKDVESSVC